MPLSDYKVIEKIGEGAFGTVSKILRKRDQRYFVWKKMKFPEMTAVAASDVSVEVRTLAQLNHPFIVSYVEAFYENKQLCVVLELCEGGDLARHAKRQADILFAEGQILDWAVQVALALEYIHSQKILHRDIKPENIFIVGEGMCKLGDFGLVRVLERTSQMATTAMGTPHYMAPEMWEENSLYREKADVWAYGCVVYYMCALKTPFQAKNLGKLADMICGAKYDPLPKAFSTPLVDLVTKILSINPNDRPSMEDILKQVIMRASVTRFATAEQKERLQEAEAISAAGGLQLQLRNALAEVEELKARLQEAQTQINSYRREQVQQQQLVIDLLQVQDELSEKLQEIEKQHRPQGRR